MQQTKRILAYIGIVLLSTYLVLGVLLMVVRSARVQTAAASVLTEQLSRALGARVSVEKLDYKFPNRLLVKQMRIDDQQQHPMLSIDTLSAQADLIKLLFSDTLCIRKVSLIGGFADVHQHADSSLNIAFLQQLFGSSNKKSPTPLPFSLQIRDIELREIYVNYLDWSGYLPEARMHLRDLSNGHLDAEIERLRFAAEHGGYDLDVKNIEAHLLITDSVICFPKLRIQLPRSDFRIDQLAISKSELHSLGERDVAPLHNAVSLRISSACVTPADLAALEPRLAGMRKPWGLTANVSGRIDSLEARDLTVSYAQTRLLSGNMTALGLPELDSLWLRTQVEDLQVNKATLQDILSSITCQPVCLPDMLNRLGTVHYRGVLEGRLANLTLRGALTSALGSLRTDGRAYAASDFSEFDFNGTISTRRFELGKLLGIAEMGTIALTVNADGMAGAEMPFVGKINANIDHFQFRQYTYQDIQINGHLRNRIFDGKIESNDPNILFSFAGKVDMREHATPSEFLFNLQHFRPGPLHLSDKFADSDLRLKLALNMQGAKLDDIRGNLTIDSLRFTHSDQAFSMPHLELLAEVSEPEYKGKVRQQQLRHLSISSDYINARLWGAFSYSELPAAVLRLVASALPNVFTDEQERELKRHTSQTDLEFYIYLKNLNELCSILGLPVVPYGTSTIKGSIAEQTQSHVAHVLETGYGQPHNCLFQAHFPLLTLSGNTIENLTLSFDNATQEKDGQLRLLLKGLTHSSATPAGEHIGELQLRLDARARHDSLDLQFDWGNVHDTAMHHKGDLHVTTTLARYAGKPLISAEIHPATFIFADSTWTLGSARIAFAAADTVVQVEDFRLSSGKQLIYANGIVSPLHSDSIYAELKNINLDYLLGALTDVHRAIYFGGTVTGWAKGYGILRNPMFEADVEMLNGSINGSLLGDVYARAHFDRENKKVVIDGDAYDHRLRPNAHVVHVDGEVKSHGIWDLDIRADSVEIGLVNHWVNAFLSDLSGRASGKVHVGGGKTYDEKDPNKFEPYTYVTLRCLAHNAGMTLPFTGARYFCNDSIIMDTCAIRFPEMVLRDAEGHPVHFKGAVTHNGNFENIKLDLTARPEKAIVLDLPETSNADFFGKVYATGVATVKGSDSDIRVQADATTAARSRFTLSLSNASNAAASSFITFVDPHQNKTHYAGTISTPEPAKRPENSAILLDLKMSVTPEATISVLLDRQTGDCLRGRGEGDIRFTYSEPGSNMQMLGSFVLQSGTFGFTFQNVIRKEFQIAEGSSVNWTGVPEEPLVDVRALYSTTASLKDLFGADLNSITNRTNIPVQCVLNMSDRLSNPILNFGIELPSSDETVASAVRSVINTDEMLMRQVLYLLIFNRFYTPDYLRSETNTGVNETYSLISSTVTGQINSWLSKLTDKFSVGFNIRSDGNPVNSAQEYEAQFEINPVRGLIINGNFGYRYNDISNQPIFGNLDIEYMLTPNGKLRLKGYTHTVDKYSLRQANTIQGVGFIFKHDFNLLDSAQRAERKVLREQRKEEKRLKQEQKRAQKQEQK